MTLLEKLQGVMHGDDACSALIEPAWSRPLPDAIHARALTDFESDLRDWGMLYGVAFGLARTEEPCEPADSVARRAFEAAEIVFDKYNGGPLYWPKDESKREED